MDPLRQTHEGEHPNDFGGSTLKLTYAVKLFTLVACLFPFLIGYELGGNTRVGLLVQEDLELTQDQRRAFLHVLAAWALIGTLSASRIANTYGRRLLLCLASLAWLIGFIVKAVSPTYALLQFGRMLVGLGWGWAMVGAPIYVAELSPAQYRGRLVGMLEFGRSSGLALGFVGAAMLHGLPDSHQWRAMYYFALVLPASMAVLSWRFLPESPRWLLSQQRTEEAKTILGMVYGNDYDVEPLVGSIEDAHQRSLTAQGTKAKRRANLVGYLAGMAPQILAHNAIFYYVVDRVYESEIEREPYQDLVFVVLGLGNLMWIFLAAQLLDKRGRRPVLLISSVTCGVILLALAITYLGNHTPQVWSKTLACMGYFAFYSAGLGPGCMVLATEVLLSTGTLQGTRRFANAMSFQQLCILAISLLWPPLRRAWGLEAVFYAYGLAHLVCGVFVYFVVLETKGRSLESIFVLFAEQTNDTDVVNADVELAKRRIANNHPSSGAILQEATGDPENGGLANGTMAELPPAEAEDGELAAVEAEPTSPEVL